MKLIIDIYDDAYNYCKSIKDDDLDDLGFFTSHILKSVANGTHFDSVTEDIKAEIMQKSNVYLLTHDIEIQSQGYGLSEALEIIDKHIGKIG